MKDNVDILKSYFRKQGITQTDIASKLGVTTASVNAIFTGKRNIGRKVAENLQEAFGISAAWLLTGEGNMLKGTRHEVYEDEKPANLAAEPQPDTSGSLPLVPISAVGGALSGTDDQWMEYDMERYVVPVFRRSDFLIRVEGDSMEPKYYRGDLVACKKVPLNDIWFQWGKVYVIDTRQGALIKYIQPGEDDEHITLVSENSHYKPFQLHKSELNGIALVNGLIRVE